MSAPCKNCTDRKLDCHSTCSRYIQFVKENEDLKSKIRQAKKEQHDYKTVRQKHYKGK